jgi:hypothetical protein
MGGFFEPETASIFMNVTQVKRQTMEEQNNLLETLTVVH